MLTELNAVLPDDGILVADGGFAAHWSALYWDVRRAGRHYIANRGHASIGYGVPGAIGAKLAAPDRVVAGLMGDGGLGMSIGEFETAVRLGLRGLVFVVVDNEASGYVKALQHSLYADRFQSVDSVSVDYARVAQEFGLHAERVDDPDAARRRVGPGDGGRSTGAGRRRGHARPGRNAARAPTPEPWLDPRERKPSSRELAR